MHVQLPPLVKYLKPTRGSSGGNDKRETNSIGWEKRKAKKEEYARPENNAFGKLSFNVHQ